MRAQPAATVAQWLGADLIGAPAPGPLLGPDVVIDSRAAQTGALFVALPGEHVDGHDYVARALQQGAGAALVTRPMEADGAQLVVPDAVAGLSELARHVVAEAVAGGLTTIAITGSSGKTSTKDLLAQLLEQAGPTVAPQGSFNNEIGVPLTATRVDDQTRFLVSEMGARGLGHLRWLCSIVPPQISLVLNVGTAHLGEFGSVEQIALAKSELVEALPATGWAVLNADDPRVSAMAERTAAALAWFSVAGPTDRPADQPQVWAQEIVADELQRHTFTLVFASGEQSEQFEVRLPLLGAHQVANAAAAAAAAWRVGLDPAQIADTLNRVTLRSKWRMDVIELPSGAVLINDAYNANPDSMAAAIGAVGGIGASRRERDPRARTIAVLGDMLELGGQSTTAHEQVGELLGRSGFDELWAVGEYAQPLVSGAQRAGVAAQVVTREQAGSLQLRSSDVVLIKASRGLALEWVADRLTQAGEPSTDGPTEHDRSGDEA